MNYRKIVLIFISSIFHVTLFAQITRVVLETYLSHEFKKKKSYYTDTTSLKQFYERLNYKTAWIQKENAANLTMIAQMLHDADKLALNPKDYQYNYFESFKKGKPGLRTLKDSLDYEMRITDAAIHFFSDHAYGNIKPVLDYDGLQYTPSCGNIAALLADHIFDRPLTEMLINSSSKLPEIRPLLTRINLMLDVQGGAHFKDVVILSGKTTYRNKELVIKLFQLGITDTLDLSDSSLRQKVREAQRLFSLLPDGTIRSTVLRELNVSISKRLQQLNMAVNYYRWLSCLQQGQAVITVNIPEAYLKVYQANRVLLEMRMVVGKRSTPTPTLSSTVNEVILYPYWHVPAKIATRELLPRIKRNPKYLNDNNYQVLNKNGKIMDPAKVKWRSLSRNYFPYIIRQSTGCDNSLGLIKINFYNPFAVYLHDTPLKNYFKLNKRYFSHGCMRMEKPMELGHMLLPYNGIAIDTLTEKGCIMNQSPVVVPAGVRMPVIVWYNPVGIDSMGQVLFYEDVYEKLFKSQ